MLDTVTDNERIGVIIGGLNYRSPIYNLRGCPYIYPGVLAMEVPIVPWPLLLRASWDTEKRISHIMILHNEMRKLYGLAPINRISGFGLKMVDAFANYCYANEIRPASWILWSFELFFKYAHNRMISATFPPFRWLFGHRRLETQTKAFFNGGTYYGFSLKASRYRGGKIYITDEQRKFNSDSLIARKLWSEERFNEANRVFGGLTSYLELKNNLISENRKAGKALITMVHQGRLLWIRQYREAFNGALPVIGGCSEGQG